MVCEEIIQIIKELEEEKEEEAKQQVKEEEARRGGQYIIDKLQASSWIIFRNSKVWQPHCVSIAGQLVQNCTSNYAETYTGINTKFYGGKQMNRIQRRSFEGRCFGPGLRFQNGSG